MNLNTNLPSILFFFSLSGYYELERTDEQGWPHYKVVKQYPEMDVTKQENFIKEHILKYFASLS